MCCQTLKKEKCFRSELLISDIWVHLQSAAAPGAPGAAPPGAAMVPPMGAQPGFGLVSVVCIYRIYKQKQVAL